MYFSTRKVPKFTNSKYLKFPVYNAVQKPQYVKIEPTLNIVESDFWSKVFKKIQKGPKICFFLACFSKKLPEAQKSPEGALIEILKNLENLVGGLKRKDRRIFNFFLKSRLFPRENPGSAPAMAI